MVGLVNPFLHVQRLKSRRLCGCYRFGDGDQTGPGSLYDPGTTQDVNVNEYRARPFARKINSSSCAPYSGLRTSSYMRGRSTRIYVMPPSSYRMSAPAFSGVSGWPS